MWLSWFGKALSWSVVCGTAIGLGVAVRDNLKADPGSLDAAQRAFEGDFKRGRGYNWPWFHQRRFGMRIDCYDYDSLRICTVNLPTISPDGAKTKAMQMTDTKETTGKPLEWTKPEWGFTAALHVYGRLGVTEPATAGDIAAGLLANPEARAAVLAALGHVPEVEERVVRNLQERATEAEARLTRLETTLAEAVECGLAPGEPAPIETDCSHEQQSHAEDDIAALDAICSYPSTYIVSREHLDVPAQAEKNDHSPSGAPTREGGGAERSEPRRSHDPDAAADWINDGTQQPPLPQGRSPIDAAPAVATEPAERNWVGHALKAWRPDSRFTVRFEWDLAPDRSTKHDEGTGATLDEALADLFSQQGFSEAERDRMLAAPEEPFWVGQRVRICKPHKPLATSGRVERLSNTHRRALVRIDYDHSLHWLDFEVIADANPACARSST